MFIQKKIQLYFRDATARFALVVAIALDHKTRYLDLGTLGDIFDLSLEILDDDRNRSFELPSEGLDPCWCLAMKDLFEDPQGELFIDDNQYVDIAFHMVKYMSADLEYTHLLDILTLLLMLHCRSYPPDKASIILYTMARSFPKILAKSSIRPDLVKCFRTPTLAAIYLREDLITSAITTYISVSIFITAHPLCLTHSQRSDRGAENIPKFLGHVESQVILIS